MSATFEWILGGIYLLLGPGVWMLFILTMVKGRKRMTLVFRPVTPLPTPAPRASVLVPVKDESKQIRQCMQSVLALEYPSDLEVIAINDRSVDDTGQILEEIARENPKLKVVHIKEGELPPGWIGKSHALHVGMKHATGDWLLFVDSDVSLAPDTLIATIGMAESREFDMVSLLPKLEAETFWEKLLVPLGGIATNAMYLLPLTNSNEWPGIAFANGQFMCARRSAYEAIGGHEAIRHRLSEDIAIARAMKRSGLRPRLSIGTDFASTRMYSSLDAIVRGWSRNFFCGSDGKPWRILAAIAFILACCFSSYFAIAWGLYRNAHPISSMAGWGWIISGVIHWITMTMALGTTYAWTGNPRRYALLFPLGAVMLIYIWSRTIRMSLRGKVEWRGTSYDYRIGQGLA